MHWLENLQETMIITTETTLTLGGSCTISGQIWEGHLSVCL